MFSKKNKKNIGSLQNQKSAHSLRFDLIFDLSLLTLCALILSEGLLILILRYRLPHDLSDLGRSYLSTLHSDFAASDTYKKYKKDKVNEALQEYFENKGIGERWSQVKVEAINEAPLLKAGLLETEEKKILFFIPTVTEYRFSSLSPKDGVWLTYRWSIEPLQNSLTGLKYSVFLVTLGIETVLVLLGYLLLFRKNILVPIHNLSKVSTSFLQGDFDARCEIERNDELGQVADALNEMAGRIQEKERKLVLTIESLRKANEEIESQQNEQLQIEKLASIGRLAAGVAHEVGNPLGAISGYIDILRRTFKKGNTPQAEDLELLDRIENETNRISRIIRALLQQARPTKDRIKRVEVKGVVARSVQLAQIPPSIDVVYDFQDDAADIMAEEDQLVQVLLNLFMNAKYAIETRKNPTEQGRIRIKCVERKLPQFRSGSSLVEPLSAGANLTADLDTSVVRSLKPETYWVVSVEDNGVGINEQDQKKLFEPFFSTKPTGKGTGLGLYVTKSIIESFRGAIIVRSAVNYGTAFSLFLPKGRNVGSELDDVIG